MRSQHSIYYIKMFTSKLVRCKVRITKILHYKTVESIDFRSRLVFSQDERITEVIQCNIELLGSLTVQILFSK